MFDWDPMGNAVSAFAGAAASGLVAIQPDVAQEALTEIGNVKHDLFELLNETSGGGGASVMLGANPVGEAMAAKSVSRYNGSGDSFAAVLQQLLDQTEKAESALKQSIQNYR